MPYGMARYYMRALVPCLGQSLGTVALHGTAVTPCLIVPCLIVPCRVVLVPCSASAARLENYTENSKQVSALVVGHLNPSQHAVPCRSPNAAQLILAHPLPFPRCTSTKRSIVTVPNRLLGVQTDRIRTKIADIIFIFIFLFGFGFEYG